PIKPAHISDPVRAAAQEAVQSSRGFRNADARGGPKLRLYAEPFSGTTSAAYVAVAVADRMELEDEYASLIEAFGAAALAAQLPLYLDDVAAEAVDAVRTLAEQKQVQLEVGAFEEAKITGDPALIRQLLLIVLDNAVKFTATGGQVRLDVAAEEGRAAVVVA